MSKMVSRILEQKVELLSIKQKVTDDTLEVCHELQEVQ